MATITVLPTFDLNALAHLAGSNRQNLTLVGDEFDVPDVSQPDLDAALVDYTANQAARDSAFVQVRTDAETSRVQDSFDDDERRLLRGFAELLIDELNTLRTLHSLPDRTFAQLRTALRNKI